MVAPTEQEKSIIAINGRPYTARRPFSKHICAKEERNSLPSSDQGLSTAKPRSNHAVCILQVYPPTSPYPTLSAGAEPISKNVMPSDITR